MMMMPKALAILIVVTSQAAMEDGKPTGLWLEEFSVPYEIFADAGYQLVVASPQGGEAPVDPRSLTDETRPEHAAQALALLKNTAPLERVRPGNFAAVFFPGGHGTMFDLPTDPHVRRIVEHFLHGEGPAAFVCHGPAALVGAKTPDGEPVAKGRRLTAFTDAEEHSVELADAMPFLLQTRLEEQGATFVPAANFRSNVVVDGNLITGQNPASSGEAARALVKVLRDSNNANP